MNNVTFLVSKDLAPVYDNVEVDYISNKVTVRTKHFSETHKNNLDRIAALRGASYKISQEGEVTKVVFT